jgi:type IV fimbrial biogenesis protein FimT
MRRKSVNGFTLVELLIVIAIIGIVASIASFTWQNYVRNTNLKTAARELTSDIQFMKGKAIARNDLIYTIDFNTAGNTYTMLEGATTLREKTLADIGDGIQFDEIALGGLFTLTFEKRGTLSPFGHITIKNSKGSKAKITFNITGRTYVTFTML